MQMLTSDSSTSDEDSFTTSSEEEALPTPPPNPPRGAPLGPIPCWCVRCKGMVVRQAWETCEHIENYGRHEGDTPGYLPRQVHVSCLPQDLLFCLVPNYLSSNNMLAY
jgi:hypothetical protein